ncbi:MAG: glycogen synthase [Patescibacteria group bacterium]
MNPSFLDQLQKSLLPQSRKNIRVLMVAPECTPYANVGGFSRVLGYLSREFVSMGVDVRVFMPKFGQIDEEKYPMEMVVEGLHVPTGANGDGKDSLICNVKTYQVPGGAPVYFLENMEYYEKRANVYGYSDDPLRWALLSRGALEFLRCTDSLDDPEIKDWLPHVIHCNDWETGHIPNYLATVYKNDPRLMSIATVFTVHNLQYQGMFDHRNVSELDFDDGKSAIAPFFSERLGKQNFMRRGIMYADVVNAVSKTYAKEILTPEFGEGLDKLLLEVRSKLFGVVNGIDYDEFDPSNDKLIAQNYDVDHIEKRSANKLALQEEFDLPQSEDTFVLGHVGRLADQKGLDLTCQAMWPFLKDFDAQFVVIGDGDSEYKESLRKLKEEYPDKVGLHLMANFTLPRLVFSGADVMVLPSKFEPCGIVQLEAMRYGAIPIVRAVGGLADTVENFDSRTGEGTGFVFQDYDKWGYFAQLVRAYENFQRPNIWYRLIEQAMSQDFSWKHSAEEYLELYQKAIHFHRQDLIAEGVLPASE